MNPPTPHARRMLVRGQRVRIVNLSPAPHGPDGRIGTVLRLTPSEDPNASISSTGCWTIALDDPDNPTAGPLHREFQRQHLRIVKPARLPRQRAAMRPAGSSISTPTPLPSCQKP